MPELPKNPLYGKTKVENFEGDDALHSKVGKHLDTKESIFSDDKIDACQGLIDDAVKVFFSDNLSVLAEMRKACDAMESGEGDVGALPSQLAQEAQSLKSQAETLGFVLVSELANSLYNFCSKRFKADESGLTVARKHIDALQVAFQNKLTGDGGDIGKQLMKGLDMLITKLAK